MFDDKIENRTYKQIDICGKSSYKLTEQASATVVQISDFHKWSTLVNNQTVMYTFRMTAKFDA